MADADIPLRRHLLVAVSDSSRALALVRSAKELADALDSSWEAVHIEVPKGADAPQIDAAAAEALGLAARLGATIATIPAASVADGILAHLNDAPATDIVLGSGQGSPWHRFGGRRLLDTLLGAGDDLVLHVRNYPAEASPHRHRSASLREPVPITAYLIAAASVGMTLGLAILLQRLVGVRPLDLLFLFPVIAIAARPGVGPAVLAVVLSVIGYNFFLLQPAFNFNPTAPQNLVMSGVLLAVVLYTSILTRRMRGRLRLSDRSARESASVAALAQKLTRDAEWEATAATACEHVHGLLGVAAVVYREVAGELVIAGACPGGVALSPVDRAALDWAWNHGEEAGAGTATLPAADWQFQPLKTTLGVLAVLGLARDDGHDPVRPDQHTLLLTLVAQIALAHERLRLEGAA